MTAFPQPNALSPVHGATSATMPIKYAGFWRRSMATLIDSLVLLAIIIGATVGLGSRVAQVNDTVTITSGGKTIRLSDLAKPRIVVTRTGSETTVTETTIATVGLQTIHSVVTRTTNERNGASRQPISTSSNLIAVGTQVTPRHRVTGGGRPPPVPTERGVRISRATLFGS